MSKNSKYKVNPTGKEILFDEKDLIVSKTDVKGRITYANSVFLRIAGMTEAETIGQPHNCIRHPSMPRSVFKLLWDTIQNKKEIFAYVINMAKNGDHYWVLAHVTATLDASGKIVGYHSNRRCPSREALKIIEPLYSSALAAEKAAGNPNKALEAGLSVITNALEEQGLSYDEFIFKLAAL